jgi:hypothetical protein
MTQDDDEGSKVLQIAAILPPHYTASQPGKTTISNFIDMKT